MIGSEHVDVIHVLPESIDVFLPHQHGSDLTASLANAVQVLLREEQVVRANLAGDRMTLKENNSRMNYRSRRWIAV